MASISPSVITSLSTALGSLTPQALRALGGHLSQSQELAAMEVLDNMAANPGAAASMLPELTTIQGLPPTVMNWVNQAIAKPNDPGFSNLIAQAKNALLQAATNTGVLGGLFSGL